ncbi:dihydrofolate reductase family protein [Kineococcus terrestris]|uniref:dihydrofolate reductase family protein n=1 Tax=Kineococcus terrestris TaxID=2044856 RepID=UPI0034DB05D4
MRKVVVYHLLSTDGVAEEPSDWMSDDSTEVFDNLAAVIGTQDTVLLGRRTYDYWAGYWPTSDVQPFADFVNRTPEHVVTSTVPELHWDRSTFVTGSALDHVARLKEGAGGDVGVHGSTTLARSLLDAGLVDELHLLDARSTPAGSLLLHYAC